MRIGDWWSDYDFRPDRISSGLPENMNLSDPDIVVELGEPLHRITDCDAGLNIGHRTRTFSCGYGLCE